MRSGETLSVTVYPPYLIVPQRLPFVWLTKIMHTRYGDNGVMKWIKGVACGLIAFVLMGTVLVIRQEWDTDSTLAWGRLAQQATAINSGVDSMSIFPNRTRNVRLKPKSTRENVNVKRESTASEKPETGNDIPRYDVNAVLEGRIPTMNNVVNTVLNNLRPGQRSSSAVEWGEEDDTNLGWESVTDYNLQEERAERKYYGVPVYGQDYVVIYNAVPKTGSRAFFGAIRAAVISSDSTQHIMMDNIRRRYRHLFPDFTHYIHNVTTPALLRGHVPFTKLPSRFLYINIVRDPMERFISEYYFMRNGDSRIGAVSSQLSHGYKPNDLPEGWNDTLDECVRRISTLCDPGSGMMRLFCGFDAKCSTPSEWTYVQAATNLDRYTMIGLTDDFDASLAVLGRLLPDMMGQVAAIYKEQTMDRTNLYKTNNRLEPLESTKEALREQMFYEYDFYHLVRDKFIQLKESLGIP